MRANNNLEIWQVLGVARVIEIIEKTRPNGSPIFRGAFISDVMGLSKTFQATIFILEVCLMLLEKEFQNPFSNPSCVALQSLEPFYK
jgi:hypothetical protein